MAILSLHKRGICLRCLDPTSIYLKDKDSFKFGIFVPKILKIQGSQILAEDEQTMGCLGDVRFRAPEVVKNKPYSFKADCWTFGVLLFFFLTKKLPFDAQAKPLKNKNSLTEEEIA